MGVLVAKRRRQFRSPRPIDRKRAPGRGSAHIDCPGLGHRPGCSYGFERESVGSVAGLEEWQSRRIGLLNRLSECFLDGRSQSRVRHSVREMVAQRVYGLALGYEDLNDHEQLREIRR